MTDEARDARLLTKALRKVEDRAKELRWAEERPWTVKTHVWSEQGLAVVDLHDLNAKLATAVAAEVLEVAEKLRCGAVLLVVGVGRHSAGAPVLQGVVTKALSAGPYKVRMAARGRVALVVDPARAPAAATGGGDWLITAWWLFVLAALATVLARGCLA